MIADILLIAIIVVIAYILWRAGGVLFDYLSVTLGRREQRLLEEGVRLGLTEAYRLLNTHTRVQGRSPSVDRVLRMLREAMGERK